jgi:hypothetical protein
MLQYVLLHLHTYIVLRCCTFSCSCTHTSCYAVEAADAADDDGGCDDDEDDDDGGDDDDEEEEELVDETSVLFSPFQFNSGAPLRDPAPCF